MSGVSLARSQRIDWQGVVLPRAVEIVQSYSTGVTLRQLFYRLVSEGLIPNRQTYYKTLSSVTAEARRQHQFPNLLDRTRRIHEDRSFSDTNEALSWLQQIYRRDRTEGQAWKIYIGVEKHGLVEQLRSWFGPLGLPIISLGGYSSQTYVDEVAADVSADGRSAVLLYAGDFDPSGEDIPRDFVYRVAMFGETRRIALTDEQVEEYDLPPQLGKATDSRASQFVARHGRLVQVELDALDPDTLRRLYSSALDEYWDMSMYEAVMEQEDEERETLGEEE